MNSSNKIEFCFKKNSALRAEIFRLMYEYIFLGAARLFLRLTTTYFGKLDQIHDKYCLYKVPESKIFARLRRDFRPYRALESRFFARAFGAIDMHGIE